MYDRFIPTVDRLDSVYLRRFIHIMTTSEGPRIRIYAWEHAHDATICAGIGILTTKELAVGAFFISYPVYYGISFPVELPALQENALQKMKGLRDLEVLQRRLEMVLTDRLRFLPALARAVSEAVLDELPAPDPGSAVLAPVRVLQPVFWNPEEKQVMLDDRPDSLWASYLQSFWEKPHVVLSLLNEGLEGAGVSYDEPKRVAGEFVLGSPKVQIRTETQSEPGDRPSHEEVKRASKVSGAGVESPGTLDPTKLLAEGDLIWLQRTAGLLYHWWLAEKGIRKKVWGSSEDPGQERPPSAKKVGRPALTPEDLRETVQAVLDALKEKEEKEEISAKFIYEKAAEKIYRSYHTVIDRLKEAYRRFYPPGEDQLLDLTNLETLLKRLNQACSEK